MIVEQNYGQIYLWIANLRRSRKMKAEKEVKELLKFNKFLLNEKTTTEHDKITIKRVIKTLEYILEEDVQ